MKPSAAPRMRPSDGGHIDNIAACSAERFTVSGNNIKQCTDSSGLSSVSCVSADRKPAISIKPPTVMLSRSTPNLLADVLVSGLAAHKQNFVRNMVNRFEPASQGDIGDVRSKTSANAAKIRTETSPDVRRKAVNSNGGCLLTCDSTLNTRSLSCGETNRNGGSGNTANIGNTVSTSMQYPVAPPRQTKLNKPAVLLPKPVLTTSSPSIPSLVLTAVSTASANVDVNRSHSDAERKSSTDCVTWEQCLNNVRLSASMEHLPSNCKSSQLPGQHLSKCDDHIAAAAAGGDSKLATVVKSYESWDEEDDVVNLSHAGVNKHSKTANKESSLMRRSLPLLDQRDSSPPPVVPRRRSSSGSARRRLPPPPIPTGDEADSTDDPVYVDNCFVMSTPTVNNNCSLLSPSSVDSESIYETVDDKSLDALVPSVEWNGMTLKTLQRTTNCSRNVSSLSCSSLYDNEPLYQIYHQGAVVRAVLSQTGQTEHDPDYMGTAEYFECVTNIIKRSTSQRNGSSVRMSTLEAAMASGTSFKRLWCEMPRVKDSGALDTMSQDERRLQEAQFEIISSEVSYLKSMNVLVSHFMTNLGRSVDRDKEAIMTRDDFNHLFSNARAVRDASARLVQALDHLWQTNCVLDPVTLSQVITDVTQKYFNVYVIYCSNAMYQDRKLHQLVEQNAEFLFTLNHLETTSECQSLPLSSFLALPMQRVTRLPLLVSAVCQRIELTLNQLSPPQLTRCLSLLQKLVGQCNEGARKMSNLEQIMEIDRLIDFKLTKRVAIVSNSRCVVKKGALTQFLQPTSSFLKKTRRTLHFFLFNDLLIITKKRNFRERPYEVLEHSVRSHVHAEMIADEEVPDWLPSNVNNNTNNLFFLAIMDKQIKFILAADSQSERTRWIQALTPPEPTEDDERIYEQWDCPQVQSVSRYVATEADELTLEESDVVNVLRKTVDGWYYGERIRDSEQGWFPAHCTIEIENAHVRARNLRQQFRLQRRVSDMSLVSTANNTSVISTATNVVHSN